jgi:hypothetical protein
MKRSLVAASLVVAAVLAGAFWLRSSPRSTVSSPAAATRESAVTAAPSISPAPTIMRGSVASRPATPDPRLAALISSSDGTPADFLLDADGHLIKEVGSDRHSPSYRRPLREYTYVGDKLIRLVKYIYTGKQTQIIQADLAYKPDGSIEQYRETTRHEDSE